MARGHKQGMAAAERISGDLCLADEPFCPKPGRRFAGFASWSASHFFGPLALSSEALDFAWFESGQFYDDEVRTFFGLQQSGWEPLCAVALGTRVPGDKDKTAVTGVALDWRD